MSKTVGVCVIAKNEEALIGRMLESVKLADQIVVVDTGSTDRTIEIAQQFTDEVYIDYIWTDDFSGAQNHAKSKMVTDWILSIDCDEYLDCSFDEVRKAIEQAENIVSVTMVAEGDPENIFRFGRLFRNTPDIYWEQKIHKHLNVPGEGEHVGNVRIVYGYSPAHQLDPDRSLRMLERTVSQEENPVRNLYYLGREYYYKQRYQDCIDTLKRYVRVGDWDAEIADACLIMAQSHLILNQLEASAANALQAIKINTNFKEAILHMEMISSPDNKPQWARMARTANNQRVVWARVPVDPPQGIVFFAPHNDDESLFGAFTLIREKPLVVIITDSYIQPLRGDVGCEADKRRKETIEAMAIAGCPVMFLGIPDTELTDQGLRDRLKGFNAETVYAPAIQGGNKQHDIVGRVAGELFGDNCKYYTTYTKTQLHTTGQVEIKPTGQELELKNKMLECYSSQLRLASTHPHFEAVKGKSEWLA